MATYIRRREFVSTLLGGAATWPLGARAQQGDHSARVGILTPGGARANPLFAAFQQEMNRFGYVEGRNLVLEFRSAADDPKRLPELAAELFDCRSTSSLWKALEPLGQPRRQPQASRS